MTEWILSIEGTPMAAQVAMILALVAALAHATLGALQKGRFDPWLSRGAIDICASAIAIPVVFLVPAPTWDVFILLPAVFVVHLAYKWVLAMAYSRGAFTAVYPVVRGTGPLATVIFAILIFGESYDLGQWAGIAMLSGGIFGLAAYNLRHARLDSPEIATALALAVLTGVIVAVYTVLDAYVIRLTPDPFTFIAWFFLMEGFNFPPFLWRRWRQAQDLGRLFRRGLIGALIAWVSFGAVFLATRLDKVGEAAVLRETSVVFAAIIGWLFLRERIGPVRAALMGVIAAGAVFVEFG